MLTNLIHLLPQLMRGAQVALVGGAAANEVTGDAITQVTSTTSAEMLVGVIVMAVSELVMRWVRKRLAQ